MYNQKFKQREKRTNNKRVNTIIMMQNFLNIIYVKTKYIKNISIFVIIFNKYKIRKRSQKELLLTLKFSYKDRRLHKCNSQNVWKNQISSRIIQRK